MVYNCCKHRCAPCARERGGMSLPCFLGKTNDVRLSIYYSSIKNGGSRTLGGWGEHKNGFLLSIKVWGISENDAVTIS